MSSDRKSLIKGISSGYAFTLTGLFVSLFMVPFSLKYLDRSEYAIFAIASDLISWLSVANLGITAVYSNKAGQFLGNKSIKELIVLTSTTFFIQLATSVFIILVGIIVVANPTILFPGGDNQFLDLRWFLFLLVVSYLINYIFQPLNTLLVADKQIHVDNYLKFGSLIIRTGLNIVLLMNGYKVLAFAISSVVATVLISVVTVYRLRKTMPDISIRWKFFDRSQIPFLFKMGIWFTIGGIAGILIFRIDSYLIAKFISLSIVTSFVISSKLYQIADTFHKQLFNTTRPYFAQIIGRKEDDKLKNMYDTTFYISYLAAVIMGTGVFILNKWFIGIWVGEDLFIGNFINFLLCINFILQACVLPNRILLATSFYKIEIHNFTRVFEGLAKLALGILLIVNYDIIGLIASSIIASILFSNTALNFLTSSFFKEGFLKKISPFFWVLFLPIFLFSDSYYLQLLFVISILVFVFIFVFFKLDRFKKVKAVFAKS